MEVSDEGTVWTPQRFERLIEGIDAIVWEADAETFAFTYVSPGAERILGYPVKEWLVEPDFWTSILHPDDRDRAVKICTEASARGDDHDLEYRVIAADGRAVWLRDCVRVHMDLDLGRRILRGVMLDVTAQKSAEEQQRVTEQRFRTAFEDSAVGMALVGLDGRFIRVNDAMCRITGRSADQLAGMSFEQVTHPDDRHEGRLGTSRLVSGEIDTWQREKRYLRPNGEIVWGQLTSTLIRDENGEPSHWVTQVLDITDRKLAELAVRAANSIHAELAAIMQSSADAIVGSTLDGVISSWNRAAEELFGYTNDEIVGRKANVLFPGRPRIPELLRSGMRELAGLARRKDGSTFDFVASVSPIVGDDGEIVGIAGSVKDVTDQRMLEEQFRQAQKMEAVARLAGGVSHDFNNLLTAIIGNCELLLGDETLSPDVREQITEICEAAEIGESVASQLLDLSRRRVVATEVVCLRTVLTRLEPVLRRLLGETVELVLSMNGTPVTVRGDAGQLEQVILNLAVNARDAMPEGGRFSVVLGTTEIAHDDPLGRFGLTPGRYAMVTGTDTGTGMEPGVKERIFEPFFTTKVGATGTGLGLSTAYQIVSEAGGHITVDSTIGRGTTFTIYLPLVDEAASDDATDSPVSPAATRGTVLLVEDDPRVRNVAERVLRADGHLVIAADDGLDALERFAHRSGPIDVVVTDVVMRGMGGPALVERLVAEDPAIAVVYISGYTGEDTAAAAAADRAMFLAKPFKRQHLAGAVREVLAGRGPK